jgi:hypothetical protein
MPPDRSFMASPYSVSWSFAKVMLFIGGALAFVPYPNTPKTAPSRCFVSHTGLIDGLSPLHMSSAKDDIKVRAATEAWIEDWVISLNLCPWAYLTRGTTNGQPRTRIVLLRGGEDHLQTHTDAVLREANSLRQHNMHDGIESTRCLFTTLLVFPDVAFLGDGPPQQNCGAFPTLVRQVQARLNQEYSNLLSSDDASLEAPPGRIDLLAFHRWRVDEGPGTTHDIEDAAHFSVRSPYPTLQLLLGEDLLWARRQWQEKHAVCVCVLSYLLPRKS